MLSQRMLTNIEQQQEHQQQPPSAAPLDDGDGRAVTVVTHTPSASSSPVASPGVAPGNNNNDNNAPPAPFIRPLWPAHFTPCGDFGCCGCCIIPRGAICSWLYIGGVVTAVTVLFNVLIVPSGEVWSRVVTIVLYLGSMAVLITGGSIDPGIVLPKREGEPPDEPKKVHIEGIGEMQLDVCRTCKVLRPPRSSHCRVADFCVRDYDHYCGVTGTCVAERTFRFFTLFMYITGALALVIFIRTVIFAAQTDLDVGGKGAGAVAAIFGIILLVVTGLGGCCLFCTGYQYTGYALAGTTQKDIHGRRHFLTHTDEYECSRWWTRLFGPMAPSVLDEIRPVGSGGECAKLV